MTKKIIIVDGYSFVFRAYHSMPALSRPSDGTPVGALYGFTSMMMKLLSDMKPNHIVVVLDSGSKNYRHNIYDQYKANRPPAPEDLIPQFPLIRDAIKALNVVCLEQIGFEADDIIATLAYKAKANQEEVLIVSSDKDLMQLVNHHIKMYDAIKAKEIGIPEVLDKFGVEPNKMCDLLALVGDTSDNIPGVPGIGHKTAAELLNKFGSIDEIYNNISQIPQSKRKESIEQNRDLVELSKKLVSLTTDVELDISLEELQTKTIDIEALLQFLHEQGFKTLVARAQKEFNVGAPQDTITNTFDATKTKTIHKNSKFDEIIDKAKYSGKLSIYLQNNFSKSDVIKSITDIDSISLSVGENYSYLLPLELEQKQISLLDEAKDNKSYITFNEAILALAPLLQDSSILKIFHDFKRFLHLIDKIIDTESIKSCDDIMLMSYDLGSGRNNTSYYDLIKFYCNHTDDILDGGITKSREKFQALDSMRHSHYVANNAVLTFVSHEILSRKLLTDKQQTFYQKIDRPLSKTVYKIERNGFKVDPKILTDFESVLENKLKHISTEIYKIVGIEFNIASPKQLADVLFNRMGITAYKKSKSGNYETGIDVLEELQLQGHTVADLLIEWRKLHKLKSTYTGTLVSQIDASTSRIHTNFLLALTSTGRFSSIEPNMQNIPVRGEFADKIRSAFIAPDGYKILSADYSQIELRLLAHIADVKALKTAFQSNQDIHAVTASEVFNIPISDVTSEIRNKAKAINFGIIYGISSFGLARNLGISRNEASEYIKRYLAKYNGITEYMQSMKDFANKNGYVETITKRRCYISEIHSKDNNVRGFAERAAINFPLQGSNADIMRKAMVKLDQVLLEKNLDCKIILQVHDEFIFEVKDNHLQRSKELIKNIMENILTLSLPIRISLNEGQSWNKA